MEAGQFSHSLDNVSSRTAHNMSLFYISNCDLKIWWNRDLKFLELLTSFLFVENWFKKKKKNTRNLAFEWISLYLWYLCINMLWKGLLFNPAVQLLRQSDENWKQQQEENFVNFSFGRSRLKNFFIFDFEKIVVFVYFLSTMSTPYNWFSGLKQFYMRGRDFLKIVFTVKYLCFWAKYSSLSECWQ